MIHCHRTIRAVSFGWLLASLACLPVVAQSPDPPDQPDEQPPTNAVGPAEQDEVGSPGPTGRDVPDIYYLKSASGELVPVPDMTFEDFTRLYQLDQKLSQPPAMPTFTLDEFRLVGTVDDEQRVAFTATYTIRQRRAGSIRVPLRMAPAVLAAAPQLADNQALEFDPEQGGYVFWHEGKAAAEVKLELQFATSVAQAGSEQSVQLHLPAAATSTIRLQVPGSQLTARTADGVRPVQATSQADHSMLTASGLAGRTGIIWSTSADTGQPRRAVLEARGEIDVEFLGPGLARSQANFQFMNRGGPTSEIRILLPNHARLANDVEAAQYSAVSSESEVRRDKQLVSIRFREPLTETQQVSLPIQHAIEGDEAGLSNELDVADFRVLDAIRHFGRVTLSSDAAWLLRWKESLIVRRVAFNSETDGDNILAAFEYTRQPASLPVAARRKTTRVLVDPQVTLDVQPHELTMNAQFQVRVAGAPASALELWLADWEIVDISVPPEVSEDEILVKERQPLVIPFRQPFIGELTLIVKARQPVSRDERSTDESWSFTAGLPYLLNAVASPIELSIQAPDNLTVSMNDLQSLRTASGTRSTDGNAGRQYFRGDPEVDMLTCRVQVKPQEIRTQMAGHIRVHDKWAEVVVSQLSEVLHKPLRQVVYQMGADAPDEISVRWNGELLPRASWIWTRAAADTESDASIKQLAVQLPQPIVGSLDLELRYRVPIDPPAAGATSRSQIPLPSPELGEIKSGELVVVSADYEASAADSRRASRSTNRQKLQLVGDEWMDRLALDLRMPVAGTAPSEQIVDRMFCQTWMTRELRQERVAFDFTSSAKQLDVRLPQLADRASLRVALNGQPVAHQITKGGSCRINRGSTFGRVRLELFYACHPRRANVVERIEFPTLANSAWTRKAYWQLVTPADELLVMAPNTIDSEDAWSPADLLQGHQSQLTQPWLEEWVGATQQEPPPQSTNQYVFSTFGSLETAGFRTVRRRWLLFTVAVAVIGLGLLPSYWRRLQQPGTLVVMALAVGAGAMMFPRQTLLLAPAAAIGAALLAMSRCVAWWMEQARPARFVDSPSVDIRESSIRALQSASTSITRPAPPLHVSAPDR